MLCCVTCRASAKPSTVQDEACEGRHFSFEKYCAYQHCLKQKAVCQAKQLRRRACTLCNEMMNKHDMKILCSHWKHMHHSKPENLDAVSPLPACKVNRSGAWTTIAEGAQGKQTCRDVVHTIASLMDSNVTALTEDYEVGRNRESTAADCTHGLFIFCAPRQHILELPCHQRNLHQLTAAGSLVTSCFGGKVFGRQVFKLLDRQVVQLSAERISPRCEHANTACFNKCASGASNMT